MTQRELPPQIAVGAQISGNEYGWQIAAFPGAVASAEALGFACLGGQFQFRLDIGTCEMYWLAADSSPRDVGETWPEYCRRSCTEVRGKFEELVSTTDFATLALDWQPIREAMRTGLDPIQGLVFIAYFVDESEWSETGL